MFRDASPEAAPLPRAAGRTPPTPIAGGTERPATLAAAHAHDSEHAVQFYESEQFLLDSVQTFVAGALRAGEAALVAATRAHLDELEQRWLADGLDLNAARRRGQYVPLEAEQTLASICVEGRPDGQRFEQYIGSVVAEAAANYQKIAAFGELVALLTRDGRHAQAVELEDLWNALGRRYSFSLLCGYPLADFVTDSSHKAFQRICGQHTRLVPAENYSVARSEAERLDVILSLQRAALALEREAAQRRDAEEALQAADRRRDEFLATLAHELRNPLAPMRNATEIMRKAGEDHETLAMARTLVERQLDYLVRLVDDLLDVSRITRGHLELRLECIDLRSITQLALETSGPLLAQKRQQLRVEQPGEPLWVDGDPTRLSQVLSNLLHNSAAHSQPHSEITVSLQRDGQDAVMKVTDHGVGIAPEVLPRVFEMFAVPTLASEGAPSGVGIGLTLVKHLVELHGGSVQAQSDGLNTGSTFTVRLPLAPNAAEQLLTPETTAAPLTAGKRILVVDDNRDAAASLAMLLELDGHLVRTANDGMEALQVAAEFKPDILLLDIGMPHIDGYETARRARQQPWGRDAKIVALTGWGQPEDRRRSHEAGIDHHLIKPCTPEVLNAVLAG